MVTLTSLSVLLYVQYIASVVIIALLLPKGLTIVCNPSRKTLSYGRPFRALVYRRAFFKVYLRLKLMKSYAYFTRASFIGLVQHCSDAGQ